MGNQTNSTRKTNMEKLIVQSTCANAETYCIKDMLKRNGFKWAAVAKKWYTDIKNEPQASKLFESCNLFDSFELVAVPHEDLFNPLSSASMNGRVIAQKKLIEKGVDKKELNKLIAKNKIRVLLFELDSIGRKINKQLSYQDARRELGSEALN